MAHNFYLEAVVSDDAGGPVFRAEDVAGGWLVSIRLLDRDLPPSLEDEVPAGAAAPLSQNGR